MEELGVDDPVIRNTMASDSVFLFIFTQSPSIIARDWQVFYLRRRALNLAMWSSTNFAMPSG